MGYRTIFGERIWVYDKPDAYQKRAQKYFDLHYYGNNEDKKKAEKWFEKETNGPSYSQLLANRDYKRAAIDFGNIFHIFPNNDTIKEIKSVKPKYSTRNRTIENTHLQADRALKALEESFDRKMQPFANKKKSELTHEDENKIYQISKENSKRWWKIREARDKRIANLLSKSNKSQEQPQSRLAERSKPRPRGESLNNNITKVISTAQGGQG